MMPAARKSLAVFFCGFFVSLAAGVLNAGSASIDVREYDDKTHWQGYNYRVKADGYSYCVNTVDPNNAVITPGFGITMNITWDSGAFDYCAWRHSEQTFTVQKIGDPSIKATFKWKKEAGADPHLYIESDAHGILHNSGSQVTIGFKK